MCWRTDTSLTGETPDITDDAVLGGRLRLLQPARATASAMTRCCWPPACRRRCAAPSISAPASAPPASRCAVRVPEARVVLVEIDPAIAALARQNAARQQPDISGRVEVVTADVALLGRASGPAAPAMGSADAVLMNPPFNDPARHRVSPHERRARAHMGADAALEEWVRAADRLLEAAGRLCLIHRPEALEAVLGALKGRFGAAAIRPVHPAPDAPAIRILVTALKGRRTPPSLLPGLVLADASSRPSEAAERVLRGGEGI